MKQKTGYLSSALLLLLSTVVIKVIGALYKIPLTSSIGAVGRGYFSTAYNLYIPLHAIIMGALPIALSRLVSKYRALGSEAMLRSLKKAAGALFFIMGLSGTALLCLFAKPYAVFIAGAPKSVYTVLVLAPSLLLSCLAACYRGYYEGLMNMLPTAVSQTLEALFKFVFGLLFARWTMAYLYRSYLQSGAVLSVPVHSEEQALSAIYPFTSAAAMLGVTFGAFVSLCYLFLYDRMKTEKAQGKTSLRQGRKELLSFSFPIMMSCAVQSVFQFLDTATVQYSLNRLADQKLRTFLVPSLAFVTVSDGDMSSYAYGLFCTALDFKNLIPGITMALGVCAVPAICREYEAGNRERLEQLTVTVYKYTALLSVFGGTYLALFSKELLSLFYTASPDIVVGCETLVRLFALTAPLYSLASTAVFNVQALGKPEKSIAPYVVSGIVRITLNLILIRQNGLFLYGAVISGAAGYLLLFLWNFRLTARLSGVRLHPVQCLIKPVFIGLLSFFALRCLLTFVNISGDAIINFLIQSASFAVLYYILCVFCKTLSFKEIFSVLKMKKNGLNA